MQFKCQTSAPRTANILCTSFARTDSTYSSLSLSSNLLRLLDYIAADYQSDEVVAEIFATQVSVNHLPFYPKLSTQGRLLVGIPLLCEFLFVAVLLLGQAQLEVENNREAKTRELLLGINSELRHLVQLGTAIGFAHLARSQEASAEILRIKAMLEDDRRLLATSSESLKDTSIPRFDRGVTSLIDTMQQIESLSFNGDRLDALRGVLSIEKLVKRVTVEGEEIAAQQSDRVAKYKQSQDRLRKGLNILVVAGVILNTLIAVVLTELFRRQTANRLSVLYRNSRNIAANQPLEAPLQGADELKEIDASIHSMFHALKLASVRERSILDNAGELICELSAGGEILRINSQGEAILKTSGGVGKKLSSFLTQASAIKFAEALSSFANKSTNEAHLELEINHNGEVINTEWSLQGIRSEDVIVCVARDVTEKKKVESFRQDLMQMVTHDLRSPLNGLQLVFGMLGNGTFGSISPKGQMRIGQANDATKFMLTLIDQMLLSEKLRSNKTFMTFRLCDLKDLVDTAVSDVESTAEPKMVALTKRVKSIEIECDELVIRRVLQNVLYNAIKYSPANSEVDITVTETEFGAEISVSDQGIGITSGTERTLFEKFSQGDANSRQALQGFGIGLAFCKLAVEAHNGEVDIQGLNPGTRFCIKLPKRRS